MKKTSQNLFQPFVGHQQMHFCHATMKSRIQLSNHPLALWVAIYHEIEKLSPQFIQRKLSIL